MSMNHEDDYRDSAVEEFTLQIRKNLMGCGMPASDAVSLAMLIKRTHDFPDFRITNKNVSEYMRREAASNEVHFVNALAQALKNRGVNKAGDTKIWENVQNLYRKLEFAR